MRVTLQLGMPSPVPIKGSIITNLDRTQELTEEDRDFLHSYFIKYSPSSEWGGWLQEHYKIKAH